MDRPGMLMRTVLALFKVESESLEEVEPAVLHLVTLVAGNSSHGRRTAGMYMGRPPYRLCWVLGDGGVEDIGLGGIPEVSRGEI